MIRIPWFVPLVTRPPSIGDDQSTILFVLYHRRIYASWLVGLASDDPRVTIGIDSWASSPLTLRPLTQEIGSKLEIPAALSIM